MSLIVWKYERYIVAEILRDCSYYIQTNLRVRLSLLLLSSLFLRRRYRSSSRRRRRRRGIEHRQNYIDDENKTGKDIYRHHGNSPSRRQMKDSFHPRDHEGRGEKSESDNEMDVTNIKSSVAFDKSIGGLVKPYN